VSRGRRQLLFVLLMAACLAGTAIAIATALGQGDGLESNGPGARGAIANAEREGRTPVLFRSLEQGQANTDGQVAVTSAERPGQRDLEPLSCARVYYAAGRGVCLARGNSFASGYSVKVLGRDLQVRSEVPVEGVPSRARVSPDGRYGSVTLFVTGHAYAEAGAFSTQTTIIDLDRGQKVGDLERFTVTDDGRQVTAVDRNFWGVTFGADGDLFYATMATGGKTYLIEGSVGRRSARVIHENVECPSLSPDGTRIAYKKRVGDGAKPWRLAVLDLATMRETLLAETRSIDDQAEWMDGNTVLYGVDKAIWEVAADGGGKPRRLIADADSPAVVRE
jgi:hypothetical protein